MPDFRWNQAPPWGSCFGCGTSANDRGFIQTFADVDVRGDGEIIGVADVHFCSNCVFAMGNLVGMATPQETEDFARRELDLINDLEKHKDEIKAWQQRFDGLLSESFAENVKVLIEAKEKAEEDTIIPGK